MRSKLNQNRKKVLTLHNQIYNEFLSSLVATLKKHNFSFISKNALVLWQARNLL